jgi:outer membrane protein assembly factor BamB
MNRYAYVCAMKMLAVAVLLVSLDGVVSAQESLRDVVDRAGVVVEAAACPEPGPGYVARTSRGPGFTVDSCGRVKRGSPSSPLGFSEGPMVKSAAPAATIPVTIDLMTTRSFGSYSPGGNLTLLGSADVYHLSNSTDWQSGAGTYYQHWSQLVRVEVSGPTIRYVLSPPELGLLYEQTDFDGGDHSSQGKLGAVSELVIEAQAGSTTAVLSGQARVVSNDTTSYGEPRFNYFSAVTGSVVPFELVYTLASGTWQPDTFTQPFSYSSSGSVDFAHPVSTPRAVELSISGPARVPDEFTTSFLATVRYENGVTRDATARSTWTVDPASLATVVAGTLTTGTLATTEQAMTLHASLVEGIDSLIAQKPVLCVAEDPAEKTSSWPMFQANARHTGYLPIGLEPGGFRVVWQKDLGEAVALNPVAAGEGKVFATVLSSFANTTQLFALRSRDGATLWSKGFGEVFSVNPPSFAYGNVYVQTGKGISTAPDPLLHAFDGTTGALLFEARFSAQWERYLAPTLYDGKVYVNGGGNGGMYSFDAYSGTELWFTTLPQYDQWTPAVDADHAFAYAGSYAPGLYVKDRLTGVPAANFVADPNFEWDGWSMNLAPVIGAHGDVIAIHDGRLISFDPAAGSIRWEVQSQFAGQPSVAHDRIYAIDGGRLVVLDELTHVELWSWQPPSGSLQGPMIVTDTHLLASTAQDTHAVSLTSRQSVWSYPVAGALALADNKLFVASADGTLTAIATSGPSSFYTVAPCRVLDTRGTSGVPLGGPALPSNAARTLRIAGNCGVPPTAVSVSLNVTVTQPGAAGNVRLYPSGALTPTTSTINYSLGQTRANNTVLTLNATGDLAALASQPPGTSVHLLIDVNGYFE